CPPEDLRAQPAGGNSEDQSASEQAHTQGDMDGGGDRERHVPQRLLDPEGDREESRPSGPGPGHSAPAGGGPCRDSGHQAEVGQHDARPEMELTRSPCSRQEEPGEGRLSEHSHRHDEEGGRQHPASGSNSGYGGLDGGHETHPAGRPRPPHPLDDGSLLLQPQYRTLSWREEEPLDATGGPEGPPGRSEGGSVHPPTVVSVGELVSVVPSSVAPVSSGRPVVSEPPTSGVVSGMSRVVSVPPSIPGSVVPGSSSVAPHAATLTVRVAALSAASIFRFMGWSSFQGPGPGIPDR